MLSAHANPATRVVKPTNEVSRLGDIRDADDLSLLELLSEDFRTHDSSFVAPGFWAIAVHRLPPRIRRLSSPALQRPLGAAHKVLATVVDWTWGIHIDEATRVGRRVHIWHFGSMLLHARSIGNDVHLRHDTTLGPMRARHADIPEALPIIEDGVDLGSGACVMGGITVARGATVCANTVVVESVPPRATVFGVPARVIPT